MKIFCLLFLIQLSFLKADGTLVQSEEKIFHQKKKNK